MAGSLALVGAVRSDRRRRPSRPPAVRERRSAAVARHVRSTRSATFDERFFLYAEETDWQLRALKAGWRVGVASEATAVHLSGGTSADPVRRQLLFNASAELFARKWYGPFGWQFFRAASLLAALRRYAMSRDIDTRMTQRRAIAHYWRGPVRCAQNLEGIN